MTKLISVVTPCYNEQLCIRDCYEAVRKIFAEALPEYRYEHVFSDNCSTDDTPRILKDIAATDPNVRIIVNSRNFGPFRSMFNGVLHTRGDAVVLMLPADLQDPPEVIPEFVKKWEAGYKVVYGVRQNRQEGWLMRTVRRVYYRTVSRFAEISIPLDAGEFQLVDRVVVNELRRFDDYYPYLRGMVANCGFPATGVGYTWRARAKGFSKNRLYHLVDQGLNGLVSFTNVPLRMCLVSGFFLSLLSVLYALASLGANLMHRGEFTEPGIPTLIVAIFFFSGVQMFFFGVLGEYIGAIHSQVRKRPLVIEKERINFEAPDGRAS